MDSTILTLITQASIEAVGITQILKNFVPEKFPVKLWGIISPLFAIIFVLIGNFCPQIVTTCILAVCVSQLGYETILQTIKKLASFGSKE